MFSGNLDPGYTCRLRANTAFFVRPGFKIALVLFSSEKREDNVHARTSPTSPHGRLRRRRCVLCGLRRRRACWTSGRSCHVDRRGRHAARLRGAGHSVVQRASGIRAGRIDAAAGRDRARSVRTGATRTGAD